MFLFADPAGDFHIIAAERVIDKTAGGFNTGSRGMSALPNNQINTV